MNQPAEGRGQTRFNVTRFGIAFIAAGIALVAAGILHGELAALLSGAGLLAYASYALCLSAIASFAWRDVSVTAEWSGIEHVILHETTEIAASPLAPWLAFCAVRYETLYEQDGEKPGSKTFKLSIPLSRTEHKRKIIPPPRGRYVGSIPALVISDFTGIFRVSRALSSADGAESIIVPARPESCALPALPAGRSAFFAGKSTFRRSEELYEARQYLAGDDPRKINWNLFAHTGELAIREGELLPPPSAEYLIHVNPALPIPLRGDSRKTAERRYERLVSRAAYVALWLSGRRRIVTLAIAKDNGSFERVRIAPESVLAEREILEAFARLNLRRKTLPSGAPAVTMPEAGDAAILAFTMPDQPVPSLHPTENGSFLLGPSPEKAPSWSPRQELLKYVFLGQEESPELTSRAYRIRFMDALTSLRKERENVQAL